MGPKKGLAACNVVCGFVKTTPCHDHYHVRLAVDNP